MMSIKWKSCLWMAFSFYRSSSVTAIHVPNVLPPLLLGKKLYLISSLSEFPTKQHFNKYLK